MSITEKELDLLRRFVVAEDYPDVGRAVQKLLPSTLMTPTTPAFAVGDQARDPITGFEGVVVARAIYLFGCVQLCLSPKVGEDGAYRDAHWFDEPRLDLVEVGTIIPEDVSDASDPGGPARGPVKSTPPTP